MPTDVQPGDLVVAAARGRVFYARVLGHESFGRFSLAPLDPSVRASSTKLSDITDHWAHQGDPRAAQPDRAQASFDHLLDH
jgi:hypothetical protein